MSSQVLDDDVYGLPARERLRGVPHLRGDRAHRDAVTPDVFGLEAAWIGEDDPHLNPPAPQPDGAKGIGEIGIAGTAAAIANAVHHATGRRIRDLPVTHAKLVSEGLN